VLPIG